MYGPTRPVSRRRGGRGPGDASGSEHEMTLALRPERLSLFDLDEELPAGHNRLRVRVTEADVLR